MLLDDFNDSSASEFLSVAWPEGVLLPVLRQVQRVADTSTTASGMARRSFLDEPIQNTGLIAVIARKLYLFGNTLEANVSIFLPSHVRCQ